MSEKVNKANQIMSMIHRTYTALNVPTFRCLYKYLVRPHIEYAQLVWSPYKKKDIRIVENVWRRAFKLMLGFENLSYPQCLKQLDIPTMAYRRLRGDIIEVYKILNEKYDKDMNFYLERHYIL